MAERRDADPRDRERAADGDIQVVGEDGGRQPERGEAPDQVAPDGSPLDIHRQGVPVDLPDSPERLHVEEDSAVADREEALAVSGSPRGDGETVLAREADRRRDIVGALRLDHVSRRRREDVAEVGRALAGDLISGGNGAPDPVLKRLLQCLQVAQVFAGTCAAL